MAMPTSATEQALKKLEDQLTCAICKESYEEPKLLSCFHVFCRKCLQPLAHEGAQGLTVQCANCRQPTILPQNGVLGLQEAFHIDHLFDIQSTLKKVTETQEPLCEKCPREKATHFCRDCGNFICQTCVLVHRRWQALSSHEVITIQQLTSDAARLVPSKKQAMPCSKHTEKELDLYCETCDELVCRDCIVKLHRDHQYDLVGDTFSKHKGVITSSLQPVETQLAAVRKALDDLDDNCGQISDQRQAIETKIHNSTQQLCKALEMRRQNLLEQLDQMTQQKLKSLAVQRDQLELFGTQLSSCCDVVQNSLRTGSKAEILAMKKPVVIQIKEMTSSFTPESLVLHEQADMEFSDNLPELIQACKEFGKVHTHPVGLEKCSISSLRGGFAVIGERATATLLAMDHEGQECQNVLEDVNSELVYNDGSIHTAATVKKTDRNKYEITYQPQRRGHHHLHFQVEGRHISGSPFSVMVHPKELTAIRTIEGLNWPYSVAVNKKGEIIVAEHKGHCISIFSADGMKIKSFGTNGSGLGQLNNPVGVTVDSQGNILVCNHDNHRIETFSSRGIVTTIGTQGPGQLQFENPCGIAIHPHTNKVYVADTWNHRIQVLNEDMTFFSSFGTHGSRKGQFRSPRDVAFDRDGNVYITDDRNHRIQVFTKDDHYLRQFGKEGKELSAPYGIAMDAGDTVYVTEYDHNCISLFTKEGQFLRSFKPFGFGPCGIALDKNGLIYVTYGFAGCIKVF